MVGGGVCGEDRYDPPCNLLMRGEHSSRSWRKEVAGWAETMQNSSIDSQPAEERGSIKHTISAAYKTEEDAATAYDRAVIAIYGRSRAVTNFDVGGYLPEVCFALALADLEEPCQVLSGLQCSLDNAPHIRTNYYGGANFKCPSRTSGGLRCPEIASLNCTKSQHDKPGVEGGHGQETMRTGEDLQAFLKGLQGKHWKQAGGALWSSQIF